MKNFSKIFFSIVAFFVFATQYVNAVPAYPYPIKYTQPNGEVITMQLRGDEFVHWSETTDDYTILQNDEGYYVYATLDSNNDLILTDIIVNETSKRNFKEEQFLKNTPQFLRFSEKQISEALKTFGPKDFNSKNAKNFPTTGTNDMIMILANFSNTNTTYTQDDFDNYMNEEGYNSGIGSFRDFYLEVSYGQLTVNTTVTVWVTLPNTHDYYGANNNQFAYDAVVAANNQANVDFSQFDNDNDGNVDGIAIIHQGPGQEETGNTSDIWSHSWNMAYAGYTVAQRTFDGVVVGEYTTQPERKQNGSMATIGVMCHEFGHNLGSPDFYDTDYGTGGSYTGTGSWDVMAGGSYNGSPSGARPAHHNAFTKWHYYGWIDAIELTEPQIVTLENAAENQVAYYYTTPTNNEYWLMENRQQLGFDANMPGHGLIIYHVSENIINSSGNGINSTHPQGMYPVCANANGEPPNYGTINSPGTPFPGYYGVTEFTDETTPASQAWNGSDTDKPVTNIVENQGVITLDFMGGDINNPLDFSATTISTTEIELNWTLNGNSDPVVLAWSEDGIFGTPDNGSTYNVGDPITGGGEVIYAGNSNAFNHTSLNSGTKYYYKLWSLTGTEYSTGLTTDGVTECEVLTTFPYVQDFSDIGIPACWDNIDNNNNDVIWEFNNPGGVIFNSTTAANGFAIIDSDNYGAGAGQDADLLSPMFDFAGLNSVVLSFEHYYDDKFPNAEEANLLLSVDGGSSWEVINTWAGTDTENPEIYEVQLGYALQDIANAQFKWNYVGTDANFWAIDDINVDASSETEYAASFTITDSDNGSAIVDAIIEILGIEVTTGQNGQAVIDLVDGQYSYSITANGYQDYSGSFTIQAGDVTETIALTPESIHENENDIVRIHPNPVKDILKLELPYNEFVIEVHDLNGKLMLQEARSSGSNQYYLNVSTLANGVYFLKIISETEVYSKRIIKE